MKADAPGWLPESLRHRGGASADRGARSARGLQVRGVVVAVHEPDSRTDRTDLDGVPCLLCDVVVLDPKYKTILRDVPVMVKAGGLNDAEVWRPRAATVALGGSLSLDPKDPKLATNFAQTDGDVVIVGFLHDDTNQPFILGQLAHRRTNRKAVSTDGYQFYSYVRGVFFGITTEGKTILDTSNASTGRVDAATGLEAPDGDPDLEITVGGDTTVTTSGSGNVRFAMGSGNFTVALGPTGVATITDGGAPQSVILGTSYLAAQAAALPEVIAFMGAFGIPATNHAALLANIVTSLSSGAPYLSLNLKTD